YGYAGESPLNAGDPTGLNLWDEAKAFGGKLLNGAAGAANTITGGYSTEALEALGIHPDTCSVAFKVGGILGYAGLAVPGLDVEELAAEGGTTLFRAVGHAEAADIRATGTYRIPGGGVESGKYFY